MGFQTAFMEALKERYLEVAGPHPFGGSPSLSQGPYYLEKIEDNLVMAMNSRHRAEYSRGSGNELESKMKSLRSSSAMTFNLLGNGPVEIIGNSLPKGTYEVEFEHRLPTLKGNPNPANLDARLTSRDGRCEIYCEMKLAEWILGRPGGLRQAYLDPTLYRIPPAAAECFADAFWGLSSSRTESDGRIAPVLDRYDAFQMLKHLLAVYSDCVQRALNDLTLPKELWLVNCVWEMARPERLGSYAAHYRTLLQEERTQYHAFAAWVEPLGRLFATLSVDFHLEYLPFQEFMENLALKPAHRHQLERYHL